MTRLRPELEALPARLRSLPVDGRGYPVPWFVAWVKGKPEFRAMDQQKWIKAVVGRRCWVCGEEISKTEPFAFVIGPMCAINRTTAEPPSHLECAEWSARNCPFLTRPHMTRREDEVLNRESLQATAPGCAITRNPGVALVWVTTTYKIFGDGRGGKLIEIGPADAAIWYAEGRPATRAEVDASVRSGLPLLEAACQQERTTIQRAEARIELRQRLAAAEELYPKDSQEVPVP